MKKKVFVVMAVLLVLLGVNAKSMVLSYHASAPVLGPHDIAFLGESSTDETNVAGGDDAATYAAHDRPGMGQTFTTGSNPAGYCMQGFWLKNVLYSTPSGNGTWWYMDYDGGSQVEVRVVDPSAAGTPAFKLHSEIYTVTGTESGIELMPEDWASDKLGTGTWVYFGLDTPVYLAPDTQYGFDVTVIFGDWGYFFETAGVNDADAYLGGAAYQTTGGANGTNSLYLDTIWNGDHTFVVEMVPEPFTAALFGLGALLVSRKR